MGLLTSFSLISSADRKFSSSLLMAVSLSTLASSDEIAFLSSANFSRSLGWVGVKALSPWMFSLSGKVSLTTITLDPSELTSTFGLGRALALSPPPGLRMMFISMFRLRASALLSVSSSFWLLSLLVDDFLLLPLTAWEPRTKLLKFAGL